MEKSESIKLLAGALAQAQAEMPAVQFNATNPFLKNKYADLGAIISTSKPILGKNGLSVSQLVSTENGNVGVTTVLMHNSGEWLESTAWLSLGEEKGKSQAQVAGSIITYLRRYSLASILGMYADEDGDGNPAPKQDQKQQPKPQAKQATSLVDAAVELGGQVVEESVGRFKSVEDVKNAISKKADKFRNEKKIASDKFRGVVAGKLDEICGGSNQRHRFTKFLIGSGSSKDIASEYIYAINSWADDEKMAKIEAAACIREIDNQDSLL